jgi:hypothetical protein
MVRGLRARSLARRRRGGAAVRGGSDGGGGAGAPFGVWRGLSRNMRVKERGAEDTWQKPNLEQQTLVWLAVTCAPCHTHCSSALCLHEINGSS